MLAPDSTLALRIRSYLLLEKAWFPQDKKRSVGAHVTQQLTFSALGCCWLCWGVEAGAGSGGGGVSICKQISSYCSEQSRALGSYLEGFCAVTAGWGRCECRCGDGQAERPHIHSDVSS